MTEMKKICLLTNDVETTSILNGGLRNETGIKVWKEGLPRLLDLYSEFNVKSTFFFIADFAQEFPEIVKMVLPYGHEVACHGLTHDYKFSFDIMDYESQFLHLQKSKKILEDISGQEVVSFRAPALRVNQFTPKALIDTGFKFDSSVAPQRLDIFLTLGSKNKLQWLGAPRNPYFVNEKNLARKGSSILKEVPVSSFGIPYIGTTMRVSPFLNNITRNLLYFETKNSNKVVNFLIHPNELIEEEKLDEKLERRSGNILKYLLADVLRSKLKVRNLGVPALELYRMELLFWENKNYEFKRINEI